MFPGTVTARPRPGPGHPEPASAEGPSQPAQQAVQVIPAVSAGKSVRLEGPALTTVTVSGAQANLKPARTGPGLRVRRGSGRLGSYG
jgi:hypothetical protein